MLKAAGAGGYRKHEYLKPQMLVSATYKAPFLEGLSARVAFSKQWYHEAQKKFYKSYEMQIMQRTGKIIVLCLLMITISLV